MRILLVPAAAVSGALPAHDAAWGRALALVKGLSAKGHHVVLAAQTSSPLLDSATRAGIETAEWKSDLLGRLPGLRRVAGQGAFDIIHLHDARHLKAAAPPRSETARARVVLAVGGDVDYADRVLPRGAPLDAVDQFFAVSEWTWSALVRSGIDESRIAVIHTAVDLDRFRAAPEDLPRRRAEARRALGLTGDHFVVGCVLRPGRRQGVEMLIEAARGIRAGSPPPGEQRIRLLIAGESGDRAHLERLARGGGMEDACVFTGWRDDMPELMTAMDLFAHPEVGGNGFPVALREAMAMAVPVVATDLTGIREIIDNGKHGLIVPPGDPAALALNVMRLRRDPAFAAQLGKAGHLKVQRYGVQAMVDRAEELYFRLIRKTR